MEVTAQDVVQSNGRSYTQLVNTFKDEIRSCVKELRALTTHFQAALFDENAKNMSNTSLHIFEHKTLLIFIDPPVEVYPTNQFQSIRKIVLKLLLYEGLQIYTKLRFCK